jgi:hypothetical protein
MAATKTPARKLPPSIARQFEIWADLSLKARAELIEVALYRLAHPSSRAVGAIVNCGTGVVRRTECIFCGASCTSSNSWPITVRHADFNDLHYREEHFSATSAIALLAQIRDGAKVAGVLPTIATSYDATIELLRAPA